jgi:wyosine [tRNA(Phe)-imidazoG37] synthetase (radical SAM superfamily)
MATFLFDKIIFGPVSSRRLGNSLGINLLPVDRKVCNFNCLYCECGLTNTTSETVKRNTPARTEIRNELEKALAVFQSKNQIIDTITFAGNGEPTMHPEFPVIIDDTVQLRNLYFPRSKIAVLSNATLLGSKSVRNALLQVDYNILKLDSAIEDTIRTLNCPLVPFSLKKLIDELQFFKKNLTIQTLFIKGEYKGVTIDNTSEKELSLWLELISKLSPQLVMVYTFARDTPVQGLEKIDRPTLYSIASRVRNLGIPVSVST